MQNRYVSLDIETSGFDPAFDDVLEVGLAFFEVAESGLQVAEEWTQVFRPTREVPQKILALTGIPKDELEAAPPFGDYAEGLAQKLIGATVVGHNVSFDLNFLAAKGVPFSGSVVDTLDLVQWLLPTHHSYNLENLMHLLEVPHREAHRALPDARATVRLLERLLMGYAALPRELRAEIGRLVSAGNLPWAALIGAVRASAPLPAAAQGRWSPPAPVPLAPGTLSELPLGSDVVSAAAAALGKTKQPTVLVLPRQQQVLELWRRAGIRGVFPPEQRLDEQKLAALKAHDPKTPEELRFLLKLLVWQATNWQAECLLDLNLTFAGGQFRSAVSGPSDLPKVRSRLVATDHATFLRFGRTGAFSKRGVVIVGLSEFEQAAAAGSGRRVSWGYIGYLLRSFYNPELGTGDPAHEDFVVNLLAASDLFFGLVNALVAPFAEEGGTTVTQAGPFLVSPAFSKLRKAAEHFASKLSMAAGQLASPELNEAAEALRTFFEEEPERVKWFELGEARSALVSSLVDVAPAVSRAVGNLTDVRFVDSATIGPAVSYYAERLGVPSLKLARAPTSPEVAALLPSGPTVTVATSAWAAEDLAAVARSSALPAVLLLQTQAQVDELQRLLYGHLPEGVHLQVQSSAGGTNKLVRNFGIHREVVLLATAKTLLRLSEAHAGTHLPAATLVVASLPFEQFTHPLQRAIAARFQNPFEEISLPKAVHNVCRLVEFFTTPQLTRVSLWDQKLGKPYGAAFVRALERLGLPRSPAAR